MSDSRSWAAVGPKSAQTIITIPTAPPSGLCLDALISGRVVTSERWGIALADAVGHVSKAVWPNGFHGVLDGTRVALVDGAGQVVAEVGDTIESGGGLIGPNGDPDNTTLVCGPIKVVSR